MFGRDVNQHAAERSVTHDLAGTVGYWSSDAVFDVPSDQVRRYPRIRSAKTRRRLRDLRILHFHERSDRAEVSNDHSLAVMHFDLVEAQRNLAPAASARGTYRKDRP